MKTILFSLCFLTISIVSTYGQVIKYSDLETAKKGSYTEYQSKDGTVYKIGDKIKIGYPASGMSFTFIILDGSAAHLSSEASGKESEINKIVVDGGKNRGYAVYFRTKGKGLANYVVAIENALIKGEVLPSQMTSDEALAELKKAKDKLDLGLITQEEYDKQKTELSKYIK